MSPGRGTDSLSLDWSRNPRVQVRAGLLFTAIGEEAVLLDTVGGIYFGLNEVGCRIWQLLQRETHLVKICDALLREYQVPPGQLRHDLEKIILDLEDHGLVEVV
jgi:hypothetical protein